MAKLIRANPILKIGATYNWSVLKKKKTKNINIEPQFILSKITLVAIVSKYLLAMVVLMD